MNRKTLPRQLLQVLPYAGLLCFVGISTLGPNGLVTNQRLRSRLSSVDAEIERVEAENASLRASITQLESSPHRQEALAREQLNAVGENETLFIFTDQP